MKLTTWSYSRFSTYTQCPKKAKYLYIDKLKEVPSEALENGSRVHKKMEEYLLYPNMPLPTEAKSFSDELELLKKQRAIPEAMWSLDKDFNVCSNPWAPEVWLRGKLDAHVIVEDKLHIIDFKTGKDKPKNMDQLELYALMGFKVYPDTIGIIVEMWYLDSGLLQSHSYSLDSLPQLEQAWRSRIEPYFLDTEFKPNPSPLCGWCSFSKDKGGPCIY